MNARRWPWRRSTTRRAELVRAPRVVVVPDEHANRDAARTLALWRLRMTNDPTSSVLDDYLRQVTTA